MPTSVAGFKVDVVVRLTPADGETVIDVRSTSRVGRAGISVSTLAASVIIWMKFGSISLAKGNEELP